MTEIYKGAIGVTPELARRILGDNYTTDEFEQLNGAARVINDADIDSDTGEKIQQNTEAAAKAQATADEADKKAQTAIQESEKAKAVADEAKEIAGGAGEEAGNALEKANEAKQIADTNKQSIDDANGPLVGKNDTATQQVAGLVKSFQYIEPPALISGEATLEALKDKVNEIVTYLIQQNRLQEIAGQMDQES